MVDSPPLSPLSSFDHVRLLEHFLTLSTLMGLMGEKTLSGPRQERPKYPIHLQRFPPAGPLQISTPNSLLKIPNRVTGGKKKKKKEMFFTRDFKRDFSCKGPPLCTVSGIFKGSAPVDIMPCSCTRMSKRANPLSRLSHFRNDASFWGVIVVIWVLSSPTPVIIFIVGVIYSKGG